MFATGYDAQLIHFLGKGVGANALSRAGQLLTSQGYLVSRLSALNPTTMVNFAALFADVVISEGYVDGGELSIPMFVIIEFYFRDAIIR